MSEHDPLIIGISGNNRSDEVALGEAEARSRT